MQKFDQKANKKDGSSFILGSGSPRRRELLGEIINDFTVIISDSEEMESHPGGPLLLVQENARLKAKAVAQLHPRSWVLGADTLVAMGEMVMGKPKDLDEAFNMLRSLSGKTHEVSTGLCLVHVESNYEETRVETSLVTFNDINNKIIDEYFEHVNPLDKAGGYAIQTRSDLIIEKFIGSHSNIIGLPVEMLSEWLSEIKF
jgi:septum formation protein